MLPQGLVGHRDPANLNPKRLGLKPETFVKPLKYHFLHLETLETVMNALPKLPVRQYPASRIQHRFADPET